MKEALAQLPGLGMQHLLLSAAAMLLALAVGLPLGLVAARHRRLGAGLLAAASLVQTIPGLALLALFYPLLLGLSALVGGGIPALGFLPSLLALALYALLPILRGVLTGLHGIDPAIVEAADGIGMTPAQKLRIVEAPLAAPVVMAGIRTAAVWTIGAATLATTVGQPSLGNLIFSGLQTQTTTLVLAGCIGAAALALLVDGLLALAERGIAARRRLLVLLPLLGLAALIGAAVVSTLRPASAETITIGAKNFAEQFILARLIGSQLEAHGLRVSYEDGLGSAVALSALEAGRIDAYVDYAGTIWANAMKRSDAPSAQVMTAEIDRWLRARSGARVIGSLGFENAYALAMRRRDAERLGVRSLSDLARVAPQLRLGADLEFLDRPEWSSLRARYGLRFREARAFSPTFMYRAVADGQVDVISAFSSDGRIAADDLVVLADDRGVVPRYDALLLVSGTAPPDLGEALKPLVGSISVERMRAANLLVDRDTGKQSPAQAAAWLSRNSPALRSGDRGR